MFDTLIICYRIIYLNIKKMQKNKLEELASERNHPCVTISMNTHRTHPDTLQDSIELKKLLHEAKERVVSEFGKRPVTELLEKIDAVEKGIDMNYNLDSLHIFLSNTTQEILKSPWPIAEDNVQLSDSYAIKPLIKELNRTEEYLILVLSQSGVSLFHAINDAIGKEIRTDGFPFDKKHHYLTDHQKLSEGKLVDDMVREYFNTVDKAVVKVHNETGMNCIVFCTEDNYTRLVQVADKPSVYMGHVHINYDDTSKKTLATDAWKIVSAHQKQTRVDAMNEMQEAVGKGNVITDLSDIYRAVKEGRGDLLILQDAFHQAVKMTGEYTFDLVDDITEPGVIDNITDRIAWDVVAKNGRSIFTNKDESPSIENISLKVRY